MPITKDIITRSTGDNDSAVQVFIENAFVDLPIRKTSPFNWEAPVYTIAGAAIPTEFYVQTTNSISASLNNEKTIVFNFSANTASMSATTQMVHDVYRLEYDIFNEVANNIGNTGNTFFEDVIDSLSVPITTVTEDCSGSTFLVSTSHTLELPVEIKPTGEYTQNLLIDRAQYFIDSRWTFPKNIDQTLGEIVIFSSETQDFETLYVVPTATTENLVSSQTVTQITGGTFEGTLVSGGSYFTYFVPCQKPSIDVINNQPQIVGEIPTFSPIFSWNNSNSVDVDYNKIQVSYNILDTGFTGSTSVFVVPQVPNSDAELIHNASKILTPNSDFIYRVANVKEIINIFGIKQNISVYSRFEYAKTANNGAFVLSGHTYRSVVGGTPISGVQITATTLASFSSVDIGADSITDESLSSAVSQPLAGAIGSTVVVTSDSDGYYSFGDLVAGTYLLTAQSLSYPQYHTVTITITDSSTTVDFVFSIVWGSESVTFFDPYIFI